MAFQSSLSSVLLMSSSLDEFFFITKLFKLSMYFMRCFTLLLKPQIFPLNVCFSCSLAMGICPNNFSCLFLLVLSRDLLYPAISITSSFDFFSVHDILILLRMCHLNQYSSFISNSRTDEIFIVGGGIARQFLARTSALITTYIAAERCLCVILPLKVKAIITRTRTCVIMVTIYLFSFGPYFFIYGNYRIGWYYYPDVNRTLLGAPYVDGKVNNFVDRVIFTVVGTFLPQFSFVSTCICTIYLVIYLRMASKFRLSHTSASVKMSSKKQARHTLKTKQQEGGKNLEQITKQLSEIRHSQAVDSKNGDSQSQDSQTGDFQTRDSQTRPGPTIPKTSSSKEDRVVRIVVVIAVAFIIGFVPGSISFLLYLGLPGFTLYGQYSQLFTVVFGISFFTEQINSSINMFIYYSMATNFRNMVNKMFSLKTSD